MQPVKTIGLFQWRHDDADLWLSQCDGPFGHITPKLKLIPGDPTADHILCIGPPVSASGNPKLTGLARRIAKLKGDYDAQRGRLAFKQLGRNPEHITCLVYEPPCAFSDAWFSMARECCNAVYAPDPRATHPIRLPATWSFHDRIQALRDEPPLDHTERPIRAALITSGKVLWPGHEERLAFVEKLRKADLDITLFGRGLRQSLKPRGPIASKATVLRAATFTIAIENDDTNELYVTEKLWDPLICWSLPLYHGPAAANQLLQLQNNPQSTQQYPFLRIPSLDDAGIDFIRQTIAQPQLHNFHLPAIAEARAKALTTLRLTEWIRRTIAMNEPHAQPWSASTTHTTAATSS